MSKRERLGAGGRMTDDAMGERAHQNSSVLRQFVGWAQDVTELLLSEDTFELFMSL